MPKSSAERLAPFDLFGIDGLLDDEERAVRDTVRRFCDDRIVPMYEKGRTDDGPCRSIASSRPARTAVSASVQLASLNAPTPFLPERRSGTRSRSGWYVRSSYRCIFTHRWPAVTG